MRGALEGLIGTITIEIDLGRDAFTLTYDPERLSRTDIAEAIRELGFTPRFMSVDDTSNRSDGGDVVGVLEHSATGSGALPEPVAEAVAEAGRQGRLVLVNFTAEWCAPCRVIESVVLPDEQVQEALRNYVLVRVDTDTRPLAVRRFRVEAMPTLLILDEEGDEISRLVGPVDAAHLAAELARMVENRR